MLDFLEAYFYHLLNFRIYLLDPNHKQYLTIFINLDIIVLSLCVILS